VEKVLASLGGRGQELSVAEERLGSAYPSWPVRAGTGHIRECGQTNGTMALAYGLPTLPWATSSVSETAA
jgi:hypothetical protein